LQVEGYALHLEPEAVLPRQVDERRLDLRVEERLAVLDDGHERARDVGPAEAGVERVDVGIRAEADADVHEGVRRGRALRDRGDDTDEVLAFATRGVRRWRSQQRRQEEERRRAHHWRR
jgi:hypothetical protein